MGLFDLLLKRGRTFKRFDFSQLCCDLHSHLIPDIDDGVIDVEESVSLIRQFKQLGFTRLITTPHIQDEFFKNTPEIINSGLEEVKQALIKENIDIEIEAAGEYLLDDGFEKKMQNGGLMTFGKKHILVELSFYSPHPNFKSFIFDLQLDGYQVIMAHPERYSYWYRDFKKFEELKDSGILFQLNLVSLSGHYGETVKKIAQKMIEMQMIDLVGSDMHNQHYMNSYIKAANNKWFHKLFASGNLKNHTL